MDPVRSKKTDRPLSGLYPSQQPNKMPILSGRQIYPDHGPSDTSRKSRSTRPTGSLTASTAPFFRTGKFQDRKFGLNLMQDKDGSSKFCLVRQNYNNRRGKKAFFVYTIFCPKRKMFTFCHAQSHAATNVTRRHQYSQALSRLLAVPGVLVSL